MNKIGIALLVFLMFILFVACEVFDTEERIPSYISVEEVIMTTKASEGTDSHSLTDCWLYVDNDLIGVFEIPFTVPVLSSGDVNIKIGPGIKQNGVDAKRVEYNFINDYIIDTFLIKKEILKLTPEFTYRDHVVQFIENFEVGNVFEATEQSDTTIKFVSGDDAFEGQSMAFYLDDERSIFECKTNKLFELPKDRDVYLEIDYKNTDPFVFGFFAREMTSEGIIERRIPVFTFNPSPYKWRKTYILLNYHLIQAVRSTEFRLFFTCIRGESSYSDLTEVFIDNVKIVYYDDN